MSADETSASPAHLTEKSSWCISASCSFSCNNINVFSEHTITAIQYTPEIRQQVIAAVIFICLESVSLHSSLNDIITSMKTERVRTNDLMVIQVNLLNVEFLIFCVFQQ